MGTGGVGGYYGGLLAKTGQDVTFMATVSISAPGAGIPGGIVVFKDGANILGMGNLSGGTAKFTTSRLSVGTHSITAVYSGDWNCTASSRSLTQTVTR
jgi:hypothetical protein